MSVVKSNAVQIGQSVTATNNFVLYQPASPDGTVRLGNGNSGSVTDLVTLTSAGNLGIGTSSPGYKLDVAGNARVGNVYGTGLTVTVAGNSITYPADNTLAFNTNSTERLRLDSSGNLGLGVTPSAWNQSKAFQINTIGALRADSGTVGLNNNAYYNAGWKYLTTATATTYEQANGQHVWNTALSGTAGNAISFTQAMTLDASGNLLLGATSLIYQERLYVAKANNGGTGIAVFENTNAANGDQCVRAILGANTSNTTSYFYVARGGGNDKFYVYGNGNVVNVNNSYGALSDQSIKENISDATPKLNDLLNVKVRSFNLKGDEAKQIGVVAQELEEVFPAMVEIDGMSGLKQVKYSVFVPMLIKAIQELSAELDELKKRIN